MVVERIIMLQRHENLCKVSCGAENVLGVYINDIVTSLLLISDDVQGREGGHLLKQVLDFMPVSLNTLNQLLLAIIRLRRKNID